MQLSEKINNRFPFFFTVFIYTSDLVPTPLGREKSQHGLRSRKVTTRPGVGKSHNTSSCREKITTLAGEHGCGLCGLLLEGSEMSLQRFFGFVLRARFVNLQFSKTAFFLKRGAAE